MTIRCQKCLFCFLCLSLERRPFLDLGSPCLSLRTSSCFLWETSQWWEVKTSPTSLASVSDLCVSARGGLEDVSSQKTQGQKPLLKSWTLMRQLEQLFRFLKMSRPFLLVLADFISQIKWLFFHEFERTQTSPGFFFTEKSILFTETFILYWII